MLMPAASVSPLSNGTSPAAAAHAAAAAAAAAAVMQQQQQISASTPVVTSLVSPTTAATVSGMQTQAGLAATPASFAAAAAAAAAAGNALQSAVVANMAAAASTSTSSSSSTNGSMISNNNNSSSNNNNNHSSQKDTTWTKLFVGGLPYTTTDKTLRQHFESYGDIEEAVVITDRQTGKSRGYGFVIMATKEGAELACKEPNPNIDGRKANVNLAILGAKPRVNALQAALPLTTLRQGFPGLLPSQYGDFSLAAVNAGAAQSYASLPSATAAALAAQQLSQQAVSVSSPLSMGAPGKARSSMSLQLLSGRMPPSAATTTTTNPYLQSMYAAAAAASANPYNIPTGAAGLIPYPTSTQTMPASTGNPMLDIYNQYAALAANAYQNQAAVNGLDSSQQNAGLTSATGYLPAAYYTASPTMAAASLGAHYAASAVPTSVSGQAVQAADARLQ